MMTRSILAFLALSYGSPVLCFLGRSTPFQFQGHRNRISLSEKRSTPLFLKTAVDVDDETLIREELSRVNGEIIDTHIHTAPWFDSAGPLIEELESANISIGLLYDPYPKMALPYDINTFIHNIASNSGGKIFMLASLNTTHDNWAEHKEEELERLRTFLEKKETLGCKLAPPHTVLSLNSPVIDDVVETVAQSSKKLMAIHMGTTPFCGPLGKQVGVDFRCTEEYVNPALLIPKIEQYPDVKFCLLHSGHEFLPTDSPDYHNFRFSDECIRMAKKYPNVYLSISAIFANEKDGITMKYPGGEGICRKMKEADICHKVFWGSDASYFQGQIRPVLVTGIKAMINTGWTAEERSWTLNGCAKAVFGFPEKTE
jgi:predicted TIM-barrel fold metal-dependent hydrolase